MTLTKISLIAAPVCFFGYGVLRLFGRMDGRYGPGPDWQAAHVVFFVGLGLLVPAVLALADWVIAMNNGRVTSFRWPSSADCSWPKAGRGRGRVPHDFATKSTAYRDNSKWKENLPAFYILKDQPGMQGLIHEKSFTEKDWIAAASLPEQLARLRILRAARRRLGDRLRQC